MSEFHLVKKKLLSELSAKEPLWHLGKKLNQLYKVVYKLSSEIVALFLPPEKTLKQNS